MDAAVQGLRYAIAEDLFPTLTPIIERMTDWVDVNRKWLATRIGDAFRQITDGLRSVNWSAIGQGIASVGRWAGWAIGEVGGLGNAIAIVAGLKLLRITSDFLKLGGAVVKSAAVMVIGIGSITSALWEMGLAARIAVVGTWIGVLAFAGYELYEHWDAVGGLLERLWEKFKEFTAWLPAAVGKSLDLVRGKLKDFADWLFDKLPWLRWLSGGTMPGGAGGSGGTVPGRTALPPTKEKAELIQGLYQEALRKGVDPLHAQAMIANAYAESGLDPRALGDDKTSLGLFQEHLDRMTAMKAALGARVYDPMAQLDYAIDEQRRKHPEWFTTAGSLHDLTQSFEKGFEAPKTIEDRGSFADRIAETLSSPVAPALAQPIHPPPPHKPPVPKAAHHQVTVKVEGPPGTKVTHDERTPGDLDLNLGQAWAW
jgi:hypothetical protein